MYYKPEAGKLSQVLKMYSKICLFLGKFIHVVFVIRYADRAKQIVNHAIINEDDNSKAIRELKEEVEKLKELLRQGGSVPDGSFNGNTELIDKLKESEYLYNEMNQTWEQKLKKTEEIHKERQKILEQMGISVQKSGIQIATGSI